MDKRCSLDWKLEDRDGCPLFKGLIRCLGLSAHLWPWFFFFFFLFFWIVSSEYVLWSCDHLLTIVSWLPIQIIWSLENTKLWSSFYFCWVCVNVTNIIYGKISFSLYLCCSLLSTFTSRVPPNQGKVVKFHMGLNENCCLSKLTDFHVH